MKSFIDFIIIWFGYTRRERRSTLILLILIILVIFLRFLVPGQEIPLSEIPVNIKDIAGDTSTLSKHNQTYEGTVKKSDRYIKKSQIEINSCDSALLESLPGIGPVLSSRIIRYRKLIGGFVSVDQLKEVYGLTEETFKINQLRFYADSSLIRKIQINKTKYNDIIRHPYIKRDEVVNILKYRKLKGSINSLSEMIDNKLISSETGKKIAPYLDFGN